MKKRLVPIAFAACLVPLPVLALQFVQGELGADPIAKLLNDLGYIAFVLLAATLACTPLNVIFKWKWPLLLRRLLGDFCFFYASLHMLTYVGLDQGFDFHDIAKDVLKHRFVFFGMATWLLMLPLAITSTQGWQKRLGYRRWKRLHRAVYLCGGLASFHFLLRFKTPRLETLLWMSAITVLLLVRAVEVLRKRARVVHSA
jgi:sulfoxide reductase heme-binding subunit YedZ